MEEKMIKLPASELEIMQAIWVLDEEGEKFISASLIMKRFPALNRLKLTTVLTLITRLQNKGFINTEKLGRSNCYTPKISSADYRKFAYGDFVEKVYRNPVAKGEESKARDILKSLYEHYMRHPEQLPENFRPQLDFDGIERVVCDYIACMTDKYAIYQYEQIFIPSGWQMR